MTPPTSHPCQGCFLQEERHGRVCPAARDVYGLDNLAERERRAAALRAGLAQDAHDLPTFCQLIQFDARQLGPSRALSAAVSHPLLEATPADRLSTTARKESTDAPVARTTE